MYLQSIHCEWKEKRENNCNQDLYNNNNTYPHTSNNIRSAFIKMMQL